MRTLEAAAMRLKPAWASGGLRLPRLWLFSDPVRLSDPAQAFAALPRGSGVVARGLRPDLAPALARLARRRGGTLLMGGDPATALALRAGLHWPDRPAGGTVLPFLAARRRGAPWAVLTVAAHGRAGLARARHLGADLVFLSPAFPTPSHPGAPALGPLRWSALAGRSAIPAAALGGLLPGTAFRLPPRCHGVAAITALLRPRHSVSMKSRRPQAEHCRFPNG